jgi:hypothetical protein
MVRTRRVRRPAAVEENGLASSLQTDGRYTRSLSGVHTAEICMAEIHVEPRRRSMIWLWIILALIIAGGLVYYFLYYRNGAT